MSPREDPLETFTWLIGQGYTVATRSVYNGTKFHVRAVKGDVVLVAEDRELGMVFKSIKTDAENVAFKAANRRR